MGIDYVIDLDCAPKQALSTEGIVNLIKARSRGEVILSTAREGGDNRPPSEITFKIAINRNGNIETTDASVQTLLDQARELESHRGHCTNCPANRGNPGGFGCYEAISYPIEADTEKFMLSRLPDQLEAPDGYMFAKAMEDFGWDGAQAADMRSQGETFFRLREAPVRKWKGLSITGDQLFHMMFHVGHLGWNHSMLLCMFFGMISMTEDGPPKRETNVNVESHNAQQMIGWLNALAFAANAKLDVLVDG